MKGFAILAAAAALILAGCGSSEPSKTTTKMPPSPTGATVGDYELGTPISSGNVTIVPIMYKTLPSQKGDEITLAEAKKLGLVEIIEIPGAQQVNRLQVHNKSDRPLLLIGGELLLGGKQDRIVAHDVIIPPGATQEVDVDCVEHGRWEGASEHFDYSSEIVPSKVRDAAAYKDQGTVWSDVGGYNASAGVTLSGTGTLRGGLNSPDVEQRVLADLPTLSKGLAGDGRIIGVIYVLNGEIKSMDLFGNPKTFQATLDSLLHGYLAEGAVEKTGTGKTASAEDYKSFLENSINARKRQGGAGVYTLQGDGVVGNGAMMPSSAAGQSAPTPMIHESFSKSDR